MLAQTLQIRLLSLHTLLRSNHLTLRQKQRYILLLIPTNIRLITFFSNFTIIYQNKIIWRITYINQIKKRIFSVIINRFQGKLKPSGYRFFRRRMISKTMHHFVIFLLIREIIDQRRTKIMSPHLFFRREPGVIIEFF